MLTRALGVHPIRPRRALVARTRHRVVARSDMSQRETLIAASASPLVPRPSSKSPPRASRPASSAADALPIPPPPSTPSVPPRRSPRGERRGHGRRDERLVQRSLRRDVARSSDVAQGGGGALPRQVRLPGRHGFPVGDVRKSPRSRRRDSVHRTRRVLVPGDDRAPAAVLAAPRTQEGARRRRRRRRRVARDHAASIRGASGHRGDRRGRDRDGEEIFPRDVPRRVLYTGSHTTPSAW